MKLITETQKSRFLEMCHDLFINNKEIEGAYTQFRLFPLDFAKDLHILGWINDLSGNIHFVSPGEFMWDILNAICEQKQKSPIETSKLICKFALVLFNKFESQHPVDFLYDIHKS